METYVSTISESANPDFVLNFNQRPSKRLTAKTTKRLKNNPIYLLYPAGKIRNRMWCCFFLVRKVNSIHVYAHVCEGYDEHKADLIDPDQCQCGNAGLKGMAIVVIAPKLQR